MLLLNLSKDDQQLSEEQRESIRSRFKKHGFTVEIPLVCEKAGTFEVKFKSISKAAAAFANR